MLETTNHQGYDSCSSQALIFSNVLNLSTRINRAPICSRNLKTEDQSIYRALHDEGVLLHVFVPCTKDRNSPMAVKSTEA